MYKLRLKQILAARGMTQTELSELTGIQQATISGWVRNNVESVHLPTLHKICTALQLEVGDVIVKEAEAEEGQSQVAA